MNTLFQKSIYKKFYTKYKHLPTKAKTSFKNNYYKNSFYKNKNK